MESTGREGRFLPYGAFIIIAACLVASFVYIAKMDLRSGDYWNRYYTIMTSRSETAEQILEEKGLSFLSLSRSVVLYNDIPAMVSLPLSEVGTRFDKDDPRFDPYLRNVAGLFEGTVDDQSRELVYVEKEGLSPYALYFLLKKAYGGSSDQWLMGGFSPLKYILPISFYLLASMLLLFLNRDRRFAAAAGTAGWFPFVYLYGFSAVLTALAVHYLFSIRQRPFLPLIIAGVASTLIGPETLIYLLLLILGVSGSLISLFDKRVNSLKPDKPKGSTRRLRFSKPEHQLFEPVTIMAEKSKHAAAPRSTTIGSAALFLFITTAFLLSFDSYEPKAAIIPLPDIHDGREWTLTSTETTFGKGGITSAAEYLTHRAYQEGFLYRSTWEYPSSSNPLLYPLYETDGTVVSKTYEIIADYNEKWFVNQVSLLKNDNPASLLFSTEGPAVVEKKQDQPISSGFSLLKFSHFMLILLLLYFSNRKNTQNTSFSVRKKLLRRNEQVA
ncbi:hypothetical protein [Spirochaeta isovalerica]|uniref:Uncharacterized protein n=1 Tax=Spirochaeta isovalerica TaxID=150 RepID=A0A841RAG8_9SPIO|nr:hypothetical protein [Spirochaeta isovalerica]MBB6480237.1 hypothetical protein [Spirochaeta isovalerica]